MHTPLHITPAQGVADTRFAELLSEVLVTPAAAPIPGPEAWFTGQVAISAGFQALAPARVGGALVRFEAGARTVWHTHPLGQTLVVTEGEGRVQAWGGPIQRIRPGDVVWIPPGVKHWHGAAPTTPMSHLAVAEALDGQVVEWMEGVEGA